MKRLVLTLVACLVVVASGAWTIRTIFATEPEAERTDSVRQYPMLVEVLPAEVGTWHPTRTALGTVEPARELRVSARVAGHIDALHPDFFAGGVLTEGDVLAELDDADLPQQVAHRRAALDRARAEVTLEAGRGDVARADLDALGGSLPDANRDLVLREPQRRIVEADVDTALALLRQAEFELGRARVTVPFDALVIERGAEVGQQISPGEPLGRIVAKDTWWVVAAVPTAALPWLAMPPRGAAGSAASDVPADDGAPTPAVRLTHPTAWPEESERIGRLVRTLGVIERDTRMARVLIEVDDPMALQPAHADAPPLLIGSFVEAQLPVRPLVDVVRLPRDLVRANNTVWVMVDDALQVREVEVMYRDDTWAYVSEIGDIPGVDRITFEAERGPGGWRQDIEIDLGHAGVRRFRPIFLTTLTTFAGLTPIILETSGQARQVIPMAISLGFGIVFATAIILVLVPCLYLMLDDAARLVRRAHDAGGTPGPDGGGPPNQPSPEPSSPEPSSPEPSSPEPSSPEPSSPEPSVPDPSVPDPSASATSQSS